MKKFLQQNRYAVLGGIVGVGLVSLLGYIVAEQRLTEFQIVLEQEIKTTALTITETATELARGTVSEEAKRIVTDCTVGERAQFDNRLGKLDQSLSQTELAELGVLFNVCASVQVRQRAITLLTLETNVQKLTNAIRLRKLVGPYTAFDETEQVVSRILANEQTISSLTYDQVELQREIIQELQSGLQVSSSEAAELRNQARVINSRLGELVSENNELRTQLRDRV